MMLNDSISYIIFFAVLIAVVVILRKLGKRNRIKSSQEQSVAAAVRQKINETIDRYNKALDEYNVIENHALDIGVPQAEIDRINTTFFTSAQAFLDLLETAKASKPERVIVINDKMEDELSVMTAARDRLNKTLSKSLNALKEGSKASSEDFFKGCTSRQEIDKRYKALAKAYHPDTGAGDNEMFSRLTEQYIKEKEAIK